MTIWIVFYLLAVSMALDNWPTLSSILAVVQRSHRDVGKNVPSDQLATFGVSLTSLLFAKEGYVKSTLTDFRNLLNVGTQSLMVDYYWNGATQKWQLCPAPYPANATSGGDMQLEWKGKSYTCDPSFTMDVLVRSMLPYFQDTNNNMNVNVVNFLLNLKSIDFDDIGTVSRNGTRSPVTNSDLLRYRPLSGPMALYGNTTLYEGFQSLGSLLFTPQDQEAFDAVRDTSFYNASGTSSPPVFNLAWLELKRMSVRISGNELQDSWYVYNVTDADKDMVFFPQNANAMIVRSIDNATVVSQCNTLAKELGNLSANVFKDMAINHHFQFIVDNEGNAFDNSSYTSFTNCGYSPILNASTYAVSTADNSSTSSDLGEIINNFLSLAFLQTILSLNNDVAVNNGAMRCVVLSSPLMLKVVNCYERHPYACQNRETPVEWYVGDDKQPYFDAYGETCPDGYDFSTPHLIVELLALQNEVLRKNILYPVWIDINDITVNLCFVSGGPYATCPYQETVSRLKLVRLIAPSFVVGAVILVLMFMEKFFRTNPIQTRRKLYWRRRVAEYNKMHEYEGVPS